MKEVTTLGRLRLSGFKAFREIDLEFGAVTVLVGANGSGKSNLISFFDVLRSAMDERLGLHVGRFGGAGTFLHYGSRETPTLSAELELEGETGVNGYSFSMSDSDPDQLTMSCERVSLTGYDGENLLKQEMGNGKSESSLPTLAISDKNKVAAGVAKTFVEWSEGVRIFHFHDTSSTASIRKSTYVFRDRFLHDNGNNLAALLYMLRRAYPEDYGNIVDTIQLVLPFFKDFVLEPHAENDEMIMLRWSSARGAYEFGPHQLSDGSLRAIALITALMQPEEFLPTMMVIDEPELGLHPHAVQLIAQLVRSASEKRQVLVATQSPRFLAAFEADDIVVSEREGYEGRSGRLDASVFRRLSNEDLKDWTEEFDLGRLYEMNVTGGAP